MILQVHTARINSRDPDRLDVTRKSGGEEGRVFAPSWPILRDALEAMAEAKRIRLDAVRLEKLNIDVGGRTPPGTITRNAEEQASAIERRAYGEYVPLYIEEMRRSYVTQRAPWDRFLARQRVVLVCYCTDAERCHRRILAEILGSLGAADCGEVPKSP